MSGSTKMDDDFQLGLSTLQLGDFPSAKIKVEQFMSDWLVSEGTEILDCLKNRPTHITKLEERLAAVRQFTTGGTAASSPPDPSNGGPPRSPNKKSPKKRTQADISSTNSSTGNPHSPTSNSSSSSSGSRGHNHNSVYSFDQMGSPTKDSDASEGDVQLSGRRRSNVDSIPRFYVKGKADRAYSRRCEEDQLTNRLPEIEAFFQAFPSGAPVEKFVHITKKLVGIPSFFNFPLCKRIIELYGTGDGSHTAPRKHLTHNINANANNNNKRQTAGVIVTLKAFLLYWQHEVEPYTRVERFFRVIKQVTNNFIVKDDFAPFIQELLHFHPGLDFLEQHEEFQRKYALTVVTRIFYKCNHANTGKLSLRELKHSNLFQEFMHVDEETDINLIREYFSYEHFYVLYCRFFELDADKDAKIGKEDLMKYADRALSQEIVDRIFKVGCRAFSDGQEGGFETSGMGYPDFVMFMLAEEDKASVPALKYWFACADLDGDGRLTPEEMWHFYRTQLQRVTSLGQESILFQDVLCQMIDFICPVNPHSITIEDLIKPDKRYISGVLFDVLFNLQKFLRFETRDPFQEKQKREDMFSCDWDRFAYIEYHRLAAEEEAGNDQSAYEQEVSNQFMGNNSMDVDFDTNGGRGGGNGAGNAAGNANNNANNSNSMNWGDNDFDDDYGDYDDDDYSLGGTGTGSAAGSNRYTSGTQNMGTNAANNANANAGNKSNTGFGNATANATSTKGGRR